MRDTEFVLHPIGRNLMIGVLVIAFLLFFILTPLYLWPVNFILSLFTAFRVSAIVPIRAGGALLFSVILVTKLLDRYYDRIGWYKLRLENDRDLVLVYRASLSGPYITTTFSLRTTKVIDLNKLLWLIPTDQKFTLLLQTPDDNEDGTFYETFEELREKYYYKAEKQLGERRLGDYSYHYLLAKGKIKKFWTEDFIKVTGLTHLKLDDPEMESPEPPKVKKGEVQELIKFADHVATIG